MLNPNATFDNISDAADGVVDVERRLAQVSNINFVTVYIYLCS